MTKAIKVDTATDAAMPSDFQGFLSAILDAASMGTYADCWAAYEKNTDPAAYIKGRTAAK
jgi:hypothetical protein